MQHMTASIAALLLRDLDKLLHELASFQKEANLWKTTGHITNSAGNLCLHLVGNLNTYIGANLGNSGYVRNRDAEFSQRDIPVQELLRQVTETKTVVSHTLEQIPEDQLHAPYPQQVLGYEMTTGYFLVHILGHLNYHLGQINYLRRVLE
jgi:uncharacterized damage-inducible protein DinB